MGHPAKSFGREAVATEVQVVVCFVGAGMQDRSEVLAACNQADTYRAGSDIDWAPALVVVDSIRPQAGNQVVEDTDTAVNSFVVLAVERVLRSDRKESTAKDPLQPHLVTQRQTRELSALGPTNLTNRQW